MNRPRITLSWIAVALLAGSISGAIAGIGTYRANPSASAWAWGLYVGFLAATFIAVLWYALVTHGMAQTAIEQADISRKIFEAAHRPAIEVIFEPGQARFYQNQDNYALPFQLHNHGSVPAVLASLEGGVRRNGVVEVGATPITYAGRTIFPTRTVQFNFANVHGPAGPTPAGVEFEITVKYHAPSTPDLAYTIRVIVSAADNWLGRFLQFT